MKKLKAVIVGCGNIAETYANQAKEYPALEIVGFFDLDASRAGDFAAKHGGSAYESLDEALNDARVDLVVNLTIHHAHASVSGLALQAGKHVYSEKPLATSSEDARRLLAAADAAGVRLASAPSTFLGEAAQTVNRGLRGGSAGTPRVAYAEINHGRIETWHPNPVPFYKVGPVWDVAVYPLSIWAAFCGPMRSVSAVGRILLPSRQSKDGEAFEVAAYDYVTALISFENGMLGRLTTNFYVSPSKQGYSMEFHGDSGSFFLGSSFLFDAPVEFAAYGKALESLPLARDGFHGVEFGRGLDDFSRAIVEGRPHRCDAAMGAHLVEVIEAIHRSADSAETVEVKSDFPRPAPMDWA